MLWSPFLWQNPLKCLKTLFFFVFVLKGWYRNFIADYGVPLMVVVWTALSFSTPSTLPSGVPRRLSSPLPWDSASLGHWTVIKVTISHSIHLLKIFLIHHLNLFETCFMVLYRTWEKSLHPIFLRGLYRL